MPNITETKITSSEIGTLWMTYQVKSLLLQMIGVFAQKSIDQQAKDILANFITENTKYYNEIKTIFENEKAAIPVAFDERDVFSDAPSLFDDIFHIMFLRTMTKLVLGFDSVHLSMSYRKDVRDFYARCWNFYNETFNICSDYLTEQGVLARPPYVTMPKEAEFIEEKRYMSGFQPFRGKRVLNMIEISYIFSIIETNIMGMQLSTGFAQVAKEKEVREYFLRGKELSKKIISDLSALVLDSDTQSPATWAGKATDSTIPPFSDKMMLYLTNILTSSAMAGNALGMAFSMRSDLPAKLAIIMIDTSQYAKEGGKLMIEHKWLEEPPQMEDRNQLIRAK